MIRGKVEQSELACRLESSVGDKHLVCVLWQFAFGGVAGDIDALTLHGRTRISGMTRATVFRAKNNVV